MAPSSYTHPSTLTTSHLNVIIDAIHKTDGEIQRPHICARLPARLSAHRVTSAWSPSAKMDQENVFHHLPSVDSSNMEQSAPSSPGSWNTNPWDEASVERPEILCGLDDWDLEEAGWDATDFTAAEETAPASDIHLERENVWNENEAGGCERTDKIGFLLNYLEDNAAPSSDSGDDAAGIWWAP
jgi:hypothetical protein